MKNLNWKKIALLLMPVLSVGLATTVDSVTVFDSAAGTTSFYSYFDLIPDSNFAMLMPLSAILSAVCGVLAAIELVKKNNKMLKAIAGCSFCAATMAVLPIMLRGDVAVIPNVGLPVFMMVEWLISYMMVKQPQMEKETKTQRLKKY